MSFLSPPRFKTELRALSRLSDGTEAQKYVKEGGLRVKEAFFSRPRYWNATLHPTADQAFLANNGSPFSLDNVMNPILQLEPEEE